MPKSVLVLGAGVAGIAASNFLANSGVEVHLVERDLHLGGRAAWFCCKAKDVCSQCSVCLLYDQIGEISRSAFVRLHLGWTLAGLAGQAGSLQAKLERLPAFIDREKCISCGLCAKNCPQNCIHLSHPSARLGTYVLERCDCLHFAKDPCDRCATICPVGAIDFKMPAKTEEIAASAMILATGYDPFDAARKPQFHYGEYGSVITGRDLEEELFLRGCLSRLLKDPKSRIAFIQCVGSRDPHNGGNYCSRVCCGYALRLARLLRNELPGSMITIFYIDIQTFGRDFPTYLEEIEKTEGIRLVKGIPGEIAEHPSGEIEIRYEDLPRGENLRENYDLVVLSVGMTPRRDARHLGSLLGLRFDKDGFFESSGGIDEVTTAVPGIFLAGSCQGPKDIPRSIQHAKSAAARVLSSLRGT